MLPTITDLNFYAVLAEHPDPTLILVTAPHCGACQVLRQALSHSTLANAMPIFELDAVHNSSIVQELEIFHLPALFLYVNGEFHAELRTEPKPRAIQQALEHALTQPAEEAP
ncbi:thioredoxin family protein [Thiofilum flexile]|uniref:thioredoxin family protein n=1 Tax=Thiofilum flexile TaxID=125627 RepID=UPI0003A36F8C|nr:thioredoxin family protein [Thiofilum flexile]